MSDVKTAYAPTTTTTKGLRTAQLPQRIESNQIALPEINIDPTQFNLYYMTLVTVTFMKKSEIEEEQRKIKIKDMG